MPILLFFVFIFVLEIVPNYYLNFTKMDKVSYSVFWQYHILGDTSKDDFLSWDCVLCDSLTDAKEKVVSVLDSFFKRDYPCNLYQIQIRYNEHSLDSSQRLYWSASFLEFGHNQKDY